MIVGVFMILRGIFGSLVLSSLQTEGLFLQIADFGFCVFFGLMTILLARTKRSLFPITKAQRAEYKIVGTVGGVAILFGITIAIIGGVTGTSKNLNNVGIPFGMFLIIMSIITLRVTHIRIKKTP